MKKEVIGDAVLFQGDCREWLASLPDCFRVDALITDPPYGVNLGSHDAASETRPGYLAKQAYASYDDTEQNLVEIVVPAISTALARADRGIVFCAGKNIWHFPRASVIGGVYLPSGCGRNPWGFASLAHCLMYGSAPDLQKGARATAIRSAELAGESRHPCPKPLGWMAWAVGLATRPSETVLDPFMGSGTTGVAAVKNGRKFIGIELEPKYFDVACERIADAQRQQRMFG